MQFTAVCFLGNYSTAAKIIYRVPNLIIRPPSKAEDLTQLQGSKIAKGAKSYPFNLEMRTKTRFVRCETLYRTHLASKCVRFCVLQIEA